VYTDVTQQRGRWNVLHIQATGSAGKTHQKRRSHGWPRRRILRIVSVELGPMELQHCGRRRAAKSSQLLTAAHILICSLAIHEVVRSGVSTSPSSQRTIVYTLAAQRTRLVCSSIPHSCKAPAILRGRRRLPGWSQENCMTIDACMMPPQAHQVPYPLSPPAARLRAE